jgi:GNAT superfamily N-acetyltransferase
VRWRDQLADVDVLVAQTTGQPGLTGFAALAVPARDVDETGVGEVTALYVDPDRWRGGVGRALIDAAAAELREEGCDVAVVWCLEGNSRGLAFYAALGFADDGGRRAFDGFPEVRLRARLD